MNLKQKKNKNKKNKKMIPIVISIISHFWPPTLTTSWYSVFVSLFSMAYTPHSQIFFLWGKKKNSYLVARGWENFKFLGDLLYWGELICFLGEGVTPVSSIKPSVTNHVNSRIVDGKIICFMCVC